MAGWRKGAKRAVSLPQHACRLIDARQLDKRRIKIE
jgi:hypothetical protein